LAVTIKRPSLRNNLNHVGVWQFGLLALMGLLVLELSRRTLWAPAALVVVGVEVARNWSAWHHSLSKKLLVEQAPVIIVGVAMAVTIALMPRLVTQVVLGGVYIVWRCWYEQARISRWALSNLLIQQIVIFEALFLAAAVWRIPEWLVLALLWAAAYLTVYSNLVAKGERAAGIMAAAWGLIVVQISWVLLMWLFTYATGGGYLLVPQPALVLVALAYCFGSIYASARRGNLSRGRLAEYLFIGLIVIVMVITGTSWKGTL
jgi:hypothetical protein